MARRGLAGASTRLGTRAKLVLLAVLLNRFCPFGFVRLSVYALPFAFRFIYLLYALKRELQSGAGENRTNHESDTFRHPRAPGRREYIPGGVEARKPTLPYLENQ